MGDLIDRLCTGCRFANLWSQSETAKTSFAAFWGSASSGPDRSPSFASAPMDSSVVEAMSDTLVCHVDAGTKAARCTDSAPVAQVAGV